VLDAVGDKAERSEVGVCVCTDARVNEVADGCLGGFGGGDDVVALACEFVGDAVADGGFAGAVNAFEGDEEAHVVFFSWRHLVV